jgi:hypothetical protein
MGNKQSKEGIAEAQEGLRCPYCPKLLKTEAARKGHITRFHKNEQIELKALAKRVNLIEKAQGNDAETPPAQVIIKKPVVTFKKIKLTREEKKELAKHEAIVNPRNYQKIIMRHREKKRLKLEAKGAKAEEKQAKKGQRKAEARFFSQVHPRAWEVAKKNLPRLHMFILAIIIAYFMFTELMHQNYDFIIDWYNASYVLPAMVHVLSSGDAMNAWWSQYGPQFMIILSFLILLVITFYMMVWRVFFRTYIKFSEGSPRPEGRVYWRTNNMWTRGWDRFYHSPPRPIQSYWIKLGILPLFNVFNPVSSLVKLDTLPDEECEEQGFWKLQVKERRVRRKVGNNPKHLTTIEYQYAQGDVPLDFAQGIFKDMSKKCVEDTTELSFANADTRNGVMRSGLRLSNPMLRRMMLDERAKQDKDRSNP